MADVTKQAGPTREQLLADPLVQRAAQAICPGLYQDMPTIWLLRAWRVVEVMRQEAAQAVASPGFTYSPATTIKRALGLPRLEGE